MNFLLSGAWINKRKKEPERLKEEEVIDIVQQAMDNPSANTTPKILPTDSSGSTFKQKSQDKTATAKTPENLEAHSATDQDPKVVEYFKEFPEPYREKAIARFSDRSGWHKWDVIRDFLMQHEFSTAMNRGIFLEDTRELKRTQDEQQKQLADKSVEKYVQERRQGNLEDWEKKLVQYIPLEDDESLGFKLLNVLSFAMVSGVLLSRALKARHSPQTVERWRVYAQIAVDLGASGLFAAGAVCRLMDYGPFDRSEDKRDVFTKLIEDTKEDLKGLADFFDQKDK